MTRATKLTDLRRAEIRIEMGKNLKAAVALRGVAAEDMAEMLGISQTRLFRLYTGASEMTSTEVAWAVKVLDIPASLLFSGR